MIYSYCESFCDPKRGMSSCHPPYLYHLANPPNKPHPYLVSLPTCFFYPFELRGIFFKSAAGAGAFYIPTPPICAPAITLLPQLGRRSQVRVSYVFHINFELILEIALRVTACYIRMPPRPKKGVGHAHYGKSCTRAVGSEH